MKFLRPSDVDSRTFSRREVRESTGPSNGDGRISDLPVPVKVNLGLVSNKKYNLRGRAKVGEFSLVCLGISGDDHISLLFIFGGTDRGIKARLYPNQRRSSDKSPHYYGLLRLPNGVVYSLAGWENTGRYGDYLSLRILEHRGRNTQHKPADASTSGDEYADIPF